jgi:hypothetical protein
MVQKLKDLLSLAAPPKIIQRTTLSLFVHRSNRKAVSRQSGSINPTVGASKRTQQEHNHQLFTSSTRRINRAPSKT